MVATHRLYWTCISGGVALFLAGCVPGPGVQAPGVAQPAPQAQTNLKDIVDTLQPSVLIEPGYEDTYKSVLAKCREVAQNRKLSAEQEEALAGEAEMNKATAEGAIKGGATSLLTGGSLFEGATTGLLAGMASGMVDSMPDEAKIAAQSKKVLLNCLRATSQGGKRWAVLE